MKASVAFSLLVALSSTATLAHVVPSESNDHAVGPLHAAARPEAMSPGKDGTQRDQPQPNVSKEPSEQPDHVARDVEDSFLNTRQGQQGKTPNAHPNQQPKEQPNQQPKAQPNQQPGHVARNVEDSSLNTPPGQQGKTPNQQPKEQPNQQPKNQQAKEKPKFSYDNGKDSVPN